MIKLSIAELEQALSLIKATSHDVQLVVREDASSLNIQFQNVEGQITTITLFDEGTRLFAKVTASENLLQTLTRLKK